MSLLLFTRYPRRGKVKTRLIPHLGPEAACTVHNELTRHTLEQVGSYPDLQIWFAGGNIAGMQAWLGKGYCYRKQPGGTLGEKMHYGFQQVFAEGKEKAVLIGTDCPGITLEHITTALSMLDCRDVVLGPAVDGGYYLMGLRAAHAELFADIPWGTDRVFAITQKRAAAAGLSVSFLETLADIDRPEDLPHWYGLHNADPR